MIRAEVTENPIVPEAVLDGFNSSRDGAILLFLGVVRDHHEGREVKGLEYEAYEEMAQDVLAEIGQEARDRFGVEAISMVHRVGELAIGEVSLAVSVASPHRVEAYEASRFVIENIKARLPVWKKEHYAKGAPEWVEGTTPAPSGPETRLSGEERREGELE
ncbi:molybdenum cofactor biosynthesis protein MoaE [Gemmatimonadota bacterium]